MTKLAPVPVVVLALFTLLLVSGCTAPAHVGTGTLSTLNVPIDLQPGALFVTPDESYVLCETQRDKNLVFTGNLDVLRTQGLDFQAFAFSADSKSAAAVRQEEAVLVTVPDLRRLASFPKPAGAFSGKAEMHALPGGDGYVAVSNDRGVPNVWIISGEPPRFAASGRTSDPENLRGSALDPVSGELVLTNDRNHLEIFDISTMKTVEILELPCRETDFDIATGLGWAFVATRDGIVIPVDLQARAHAEPLRIGGRGHLKVALSKSGRLLAVCHQDQSARKAPYPTTVKVYAVSQGNARELGSAFFEAKGPARDIVVLEGSKKVVISCAPQLLVWTFE